MQQHRPGIRKMRNYLVGKMPYSGRTRLGSVPLLRKTRKRHRKLADQLFVRNWFAHRNRAYTRVRSLMRGIQARMQMGF